MLDISKLRLTQPRVELELELSLANTQNFQNKEEMQNTETDNINPPTYLCTVFSIQPL